MSASPYHSQQAFYLSNRSNDKSSTERTGLLGSLKRKLTRTDTKSVSAPAAPMMPNFKTPVDLDTNKDRAGRLWGLTSPATKRPDGPGMNNFSTTPNEPPPEYSAVPPRDQANIPPAASSSETFSSFGGDDRFAQLREFDTVLLIDDSGSMAGRRWRETASALEVFAPICTAYDENGIDIHFLNTRDQPSFCGIKDVTTVRNIFQRVRPQGATPMQRRMHEILVKTYLERLRKDPDGTKPLNLIVLTDGKPQGTPETTIVKVVETMTELQTVPWQIGIQFIQIGRDADASERLRQIDNIEYLEQEFNRGRKLEHDIVDTQPFLGDSDAQLSADGILKCVLGGVDKLLDKMSSNRLYHR